MKNLFILFMTSLAFTQVNLTNAAPTYTTHLDFYRFNTNLIKQLGQGHSGIADQRYFSNMSLNPGIFYASDKIETQFNLLTKGDSQLANGTLLSNKDPIIRMDLFYPMTKNINIAITYNNNRSMYWNNYFYFDVDVDGNPILTKDNYIKQNVREVGFQFSYKLDKNHSFGVGYQNIDGTHREKLGFIDAFTMKDKQNSLSLGYVYTEKDYTIGVTYHSGYTLQYIDSVTSEGYLSHFNWANDIPNELSAGISYTIDEDTYVNVDLIYHHYKSRDGFYRTNIFEYRAGFRVNYDDDLQFSFGSYSIVDSHNKGIDNYLEDDNFYTQIFLTLGAAYYFDDMDISFSYASSDLVSNKLAAHNRYGFNVSYRF